MISRYDLGNTCRSNDGTIYKITIDRCFMKYAKSRQDLTEGPIWRKVIIFALPILAGSLLQQLYTTADAIIIGQFAGKNALAAIDTVYNLIKLPINFFTGVSLGATIIISQYYGAKDKENISVASHTALLFAFFGGLLLSILGIFLSPFCLRLLQVPDDIFQESLIYVRIYFGGMTASMVYNMSAGIFRAVGDSKTPFYFLIIANIANVLLDILFIAVFRWGVAGAALATAFSQVLSSFLVVMALIKTNLPCKIHLNKLRFQQVCLRENIKLGLPVGIQATLYPLANMLIQSNVNAFGTNSIAAWAVCGKLDFLIWLITESLCSTISTFVAQNYGAKKYERAKKGVRVGVVLSVILVAVIGAILYFWNIQLGYLFVDDSRVIDISSRIMSVLSPLYVIYVFGGVLPGAIRGTGETIKPMILTLIGSCGSRILWIIAIVPLHHTLMTVLICYPVSWGVTSVIYLIFYRHCMGKLGP